jgi:hypothetical protein
MIRYNAAHRGAERDVFRVTDSLQMPIVAFTAQRWGALLAGTPDDPPGFIPPSAREWYRFALAHPSLSVVLMAPPNRQQLDEDLSLLEDWRSPHVVFASMPGPSLRNSPTPLNPTWRMPESAGVTLRRVYAPLR